VAVTDISSSVQGELGAAGGSEEVGAAGGESPPSPTWGRPEGGVNSWRDGEVEGDRAEPGLGFPAGLRPAVLESFELPVHE
jgi:hypothetical protein